MGPLTEEEIQQFISVIYKIPVYSFAHEEARLSSDARIVYYTEGYHAVRIFPILTEASLQLIKDAYRGEVEEMIRAGEMEMVKNLPVSLEEMSTHTVRDVNPTAVWRLETVTKDFAQIGPYALKAMRYATDPVTRFPSVSMTYEADGKPNMEVYLIGTLLTPQVDTLLRAIQISEASKTADDIQTSPIITSSRET